jgi:hypothetical protein
MENYTSSKTYTNKNQISFSAKEIHVLREVLRISLGKHVDKLTEEDLIDFGSTMLRVTAIVLKAEYLRKKVSH